jgi:leader peptidase (prepilin peptidase)/N-methyltransferase
MFLLFLLLLLLPILIPRLFPNGYVIALLIAGAVLLLVSDMIGDNVAWYARLIGFFAVSLPMYVIVLIKNNAFGGGDIKLMAACGLILGWKNLLCGFFFGVLCAGVYAIIALVKKDAGMKSEFAFGPYLSLGIAVALLYGTQIVSWYTSLFAF